MRLTWGTPTCKSCRAESEDDETCSGCGRDLTPSDAAESLQHKRRLAHQRGLAAIREIFGRPRPEPLTVLDATQYVDYLTGEQILVQDYLRQAGDSLIAVDVSSLEAVHGKQNYEAISHVAG
jgi:hypothetical protein